ncbi:MAG TPA: hypothetical protein VK146_12100 [Tabrizicola sp.]|nr:hypothetical protein [Tabrizicola sp.]
MNNAQGERQMILGLVLVSAAVGTVAIASGIALSLPAWMIALCYPLACSLTLLLTAALYNIRQGQPARVAHQMRPQN